MKSVFTKLYFLVLLYWLVWIKNKFFTWFFFVSSRLLIVYNLTIKIEPDALDRSATTCTCRRVNNKINHLCDSSLGLSLDLPDSSLGLDTLDSELDSRFKDSNTSLCLNTQRNITQICIGWWKNFSSLSTISVSETYPRGELVFFWI